MASESRDTLDCTLTRVRDAAVEHGLAVGDSVRAFELAGRAERLRQTVPAGTDVDPTTAAALLSVATAVSDAEGGPSATGGRSGPDGPEARPRPKGAPGLPAGPTDDDPVLVGAAVAVRQFGTSPDRAASLANRPATAVRRYHDRRSQSAAGGDQPLDEDAPSCPD